MMKHKCTPIAMGDWADEVCTICKASLSLPSYNNLANAIQRVREIHNPLHDKWLSDLRWCAICEVEYPCGTIKALDGEQ